MIEENDSFWKSGQFCLFKKGGKDVIKLRELSKHHRWENIFVMPGKQNYKCVQASTQYRGFAREKSANNFANWIVIRPEICKL